MCTCMDVAHIYSALGSNMAYRLAKIYMASEAAYSASLRSASHFTVLKVTDEEIKIWWVKRFRLEYFVSVIVLLTFTVLRYKVSTMCRSGWRGVEDEHL